MQAREMGLIPVFHQMWLQLQSFNHSNPFLLPLLLFSLLVLFKLTRGHENHKFPPSPPRLPILGNLHQLGTLPHRSLQALSKKYGPVLLLKLGYAQTLVISSADMARDMVKNHDIVFSDRPKTTAANLLLYGCTDVGFSPYGEYWRQIRKICVVELLSLKRVQSFQFVREEEVDVLMDKLRKASVSNSTVDLSRRLLAISNNIVSRCVLGQKSEEENGMNKFGELSRTFMIQFTSFSFGDMFPYLRWMDVVTGFISRLTATSSAVDVYFDQVIEEHRITMERDAQVQQSDSKDFVHILLQLQKDGMLGIDLTQDNLKAILLDMFIGGTDTTSTTMEWTMAELMKSPSKMKKVQEEVRRVVGKKPKIEVNDVNQMDYLKCVMKEALRLHPPVALLVPRETSASAVLGGYHVPARVRVFVNVWAIQRDPALWERPDEFVPERFENNPVDFKGQDFEFLPFGAGRRGCPGMSFGVTSAEFVLANLLYWFNWDLCDGVSEENLDMTEVHGLTVTKKYPLKLVPKQYIP